MYLTRVLKTIFNTLLGKLFALRFKNTILFKYTHYELCVEPAFLGSYFNNSELHN